MQRLEQTFPMAALLAVILTLTAGCASAPASPLQTAQNDAVRRLTTECFWNREGERSVFGAYPVHSACRRWAEARVQVRMPQSVGMAWD